MAGEHPLIAALFDQLPEARSIWPITERQKWLLAAEGILRLLYSDEREPR
jgi:hypothetical protein